MAKRKFDFNKETGVAICIIKDRGVEFTGKAKAHEEDRDVMATFTGMVIAEHRAEIRRFTYKSKRALENARMLERQVEHYKRIAADYAATADEIKENLDKYLEDKAIFARKLRKHRRIVESKAASLVEGTEIKTEE